MLLFTGKYTTKCLDLAATILMHGIEPIKIKGVDHISSEFTFPNSTTLQRIVESFWKGEVEANLAMYMRCRTELKMQSRKDVRNTKEEEGEYEEYVGRPYWFIAAGTAIHSIFSRSDVHYERMRNNNFFPTKEQALASVKKS